MAELGTMECVQGACRISPLGSCKGDIAHRYRKGDTAHQNPNQTCHSLLKGLSGVPGTPSKTTQGSSALSWHTDLTGFLLSTSSCFLLSPSQRTGAHHR
jgi:hypothetical protein